jgi:phage terminase large subunit-like protein
MIVNQNLIDDLSVLLENKMWNHVRSWFFYNNSEEELIDKVLLWGTTFLPHYLRDETPVFHRELIRRFFSKKNEYTACPRGFAKTTINQLCISFTIANKMSNFVVLIEKSFTEASEVLFGIADEFRENPMIKQVYGEMVKKTAQGTFNDKNKDAEGDVFINGVRLRAKGFNTPIRGLKSKEWRPDKIIVDDVEEDTHIQNDDQRRKYRENFTQGIVPAVDVGGTIKVTGTILHQASLLKGLIDQFDGKIFKATDLQDMTKDLLWPERWTTERLLAKKAEMELEGRGASKFYQEYYNEPTSDEVRSFKLEWLQKTWTDEDIKTKALGRYITIDVADSKKQGADYTGVVIVDWDQDNNWFIRYAKRYKINSKELVDLIVSLWQFWNPIKIGVEKNAYEDQVKPWLNVVSEEKGIFPIVCELEDKGQRKEDRIRGALAGRFESGKIFFKQGSKDDQTILKGELYDFPFAKNDDLGDALAYVQQLGTRPMGRSKEQKSSIETEFENYKRSKLKSVSNSL